MKSILVNNKTYKSVLIAVLALLFILPACSNREKGDHLIIGIAPSADAEQTNQRVDALTDYLSEVLNMPVKHILITDPSAMIEAMRAKKIHMGSGGPFTYLIAAEKANAEAIITTDVPEGEVSYYKTIFITQPDSPINSIEDIKEKANELSLSWAYPTSCSGHLVPRYVLQQNGIYPSDFKEVFTSKDHTSAIFSGISGKVDIAAVYMTGIYKFLKDARIKESDFKIIWESEPLLSSPTFVRKDLDPELKSKIQQAYLDMKDKAPDSWNAIQNQYPYPIRYISVSDSDYDQFRTMANEVKDLGYNF
jgi:phosphonate transport system substrate-binding protein